MSDNRYRIRPVASLSEAAEVPGLFRAIYGDAFPVQYVYDATLLMAELSAGRLAASLAFDQAGTPLGYVSAFKCAPNPLLWEGGNLLVLPGCGGDDLAWLLLQHYLEPENLPYLKGDGIFSESVCHHYFTQVGCAKTGFSDCALMLDQMDGASFREHAPEAERVACLLQFYEQSDPVEACYLPEPYADILHRLARSLRPRVLLPGAAALPGSGTTVWSDHWYADAGMWRVSISCIGSGWGEFLDDLLVQAAQRRVVSLQLILSAAMPYVGEAVQLMRQRGFFFGGLFPRWFGADGIMLQQVLVKETDYGQIKLYTAEARELLTFIRSDREQNKGEQQ